MKLHAAIVTMQREAIVYEAGDLTPTVCDNGPSFTLVLYTRALH